MCVRFVQNVSVSRVFEVAALVSPICLSDALIYGGVGKTIIIAKTILAEILTPWNVQRFVIYMSRVRTVKGFLDI